MIVILKTWDQLEKELKPIALEWKYVNDKRGHINIEFDTFRWHIDENDREEYFGKEIIDVEPCSINPNFTHYAGKYNVYLHELWFKQEDFITEDEFKLV